MRKVVAVIFAFLFAASLYAQCDPSSNCPWVLVGNGSAIWIDLWNDDASLNSSIIYSTSVYQDCCGNTTTLKNWPPALECDAYPCQATLWWCGDPMSCP